MTLSVLSPSLLWWCLVVFSNACDKTERSTYNFLLYGCGYTCHFSVIYQIPFLKIYVFETWKCLDIFFPATLHMILCVCVGVLRSQWIENPSVTTADGCVHLSLSFICWWLFSAFCQMSWMVMLLHAMSTCNLQCSFFYLANAQICMF